MWTTSQISNPAFDYRHQGFSVKILELERDAYPPPGEMLRIRSPGRDEANLSTSQQLESAKWSKSYCSFGKVGNPGTNLDFAFFKIVW